MLEVCRREETHQGSSNFSKFEHHVVTTRSICMQGACDRRRRTMCPGDKSDGYLLQRHIGDRETVRLLSFKW